MEANARTLELTKAKSTDVEPRMKRMVNRRAARLQSRNRGRSTFLQENLQATAVHLSFAISDAVKQNFHNASETSELPSSNNEQRTTNNDLCEIPPRIGTSAAFRPMNVQITFFYIPFLVTPFPNTNKLDGPFALRKRSRRTETLSALPLVRRLTYFPQFPSSIQGNERWI